MHKIHRLYWLDFLRSMLLIFMISYHLYWDLLYFNFINNIPFFNNYATYFAHFTAIGFLIVTGFSSSLSFYCGDKVTYKQRFFKRFIKIFIAAISISIITYFLFPDNYIYFGILHQICVSSLLLFFTIEYKIYYNIALALFFLFYTNHFITNHYFDWLGLNSTAKNAFDFVPIFPWTAYAIIGAILGKLYLKYNLNINIKPNKYISWFSQNSLNVYLVHQPILFGILFIIASYFPQKSISFNSQFFKTNCEKICYANKYSYKYCLRYCKCMNEHLQYSDIKTSVRFCK